MQRPRPGTLVFLNFLALPVLIMSQTVIYPPENLTVNDIDSMNVVFDTGYSAVNLTVFCMDDAAGDYAFHAYDGNPLPPSGTAYLAPIDESIGLDWSTSTAFGCHMLFQDPATTSNLFNSGHFVMVSTVGAATTWSSSSSTPTPSSSTTSGTSSTISSPTSSLTSQSSPSSSSATSPAASSGTSTTTVSSSSSSGLSAGAAAGIGIGVALLAILIAILLFFLWRRSHRRAKQARLAEQDHQMGNVGGYTDKPTGYQPGKQEFHGQQQGGYAPDQSAPMYSSRTPTGYGHGGGYQPVESGGMPITSELPGHEGRYELGS